MNLEDLAKPFPASDIEWRVGRAGETNGKPWAFVLAYINARAVMDRLDEVVGPENWKDRYWTEGKAVMCGLSIRIGEEWVEKVDGAQETDIEAVKGGLSGALKRAAVKWKIGRYLYKLEESLAQIVEKSKEANYAKTKEGTSFYWLPPQLPAWALPEGAAIPNPKSGPPPQGHPTGAASVAEATVNFDDYVVKTGKKYAGTRLSDIPDIYELNGYHAWMQKQEKVTADFAQDREAIGAFLDSRQRPAHKQVK